MTRRRLRAWWPATLCAAVILLVSSMPLAIRVVEFRFADKIAHFAEYLLLAAFVSRGLALDPRATAWSRRTRLVVALGSLLVFATLDEAHQAWIPGRSPSAGDIAADAAGVIVGCAAGALMWRQHREQVRQPTA